MRNLLRKPLPWMVVCECAIVVALAMLAWHLVASPPAPQVSGLQAAPSPTAQAREPVTPGPRIVAGKARTPDHELLPGLNMDSSFWKQRLAELNRGESSFEQLEWRIVHSAIDAARRYVRSVVVPAIVRAEHPGS
jgi:hypothetical protein